ncbi:MAG: hypothetical protein RIQ52_605 [Pseudomonadota bacterium]|jgi:chemotaxis protein MotB
MNIIRTTLLAAACSMALGGCVSMQEYNEEKDLNAQLQAEVDADKVTIQEQNEELTVSMVNEMLFPSAGAELDANGKKVLDKIIPTLKEAGDKRIEVRGYTDSVPIGAHLKQQYKSNWELSTARATSVVEYLQSKGIPGSRLSARGFGEFQPLDAKAPDTKDTRAKNRRTDIVLMAPDR